MKVASVNPASLKKNPWNTNSVAPENEAKLDESIKRLSMFKPVLVRELPDGHYQILGGEHRVDSAIRLGFKEIPIWNLGPLDEKRAKEISVVDNGRYGTDDTIGLAELMSELGNAEELATFMPYSDAEMTAIFSASDIDLDSLINSDDEEHDYGAESVSKAPKTHTIMRFKVPVSDAESIEKLLKSVMRRQGFTKSDELTNAGDAFVWAMTQLQDDE